MTANRKRLLYFSIIIVLAVSIIPLNAFAHEKSTSVCERIWYDEDGNLLKDVELTTYIESKGQGDARAVVCCANQDILTRYYEDHYYEPPLPALCVYDRIRCLICGNCDAILSTENIGSYTHTHPAG